MSGLTININDSEKDEVKIVLLTGEMDESAIDIIRPQVDPLLGNEDVKTIIFDLKELEFINSKGIGYLVSIHTHLTKNDRSIILANANDQVMDVISLVGLTSIIKYFGSTEEAVNSIG